MRSLSLVCIWTLVSLSALAGQTPASPNPAAATTNPSTGSTVSPATGSTVPLGSPPTSPVQPSSTAQIDENSLSYVDGYSEGCASANLRYAHQAHVKPGRDPKLYDSDNNYHSGWDHGYRKCEDRVTSGGLPVMGNSVIQ